MSWEVKRALSGLIVVNIHMSPKRTTDTPHTHIPHIEQRTKVNCQKTKCGLIPSKLNKEVSTKLWTEWDMKMQGESITDHAVSIRVSNKLGERTERKGTLIISLFKILTLSFKDLIYFHAKNTGSSFQMSELSPMWDLGIHSCLKGKASFWFKD